jgi:hypothetical protein
MTDPRPNVITVATGPDRLARFDGAVRHFLRKETVPPLLTPEEWATSGGRYLIDAGDQQDRAVHAEVYSLVCGGCLDEVAIRELHGAESARVAVDLVETGHAVICSLDVADTAAARAHFEAATGRDLSWFQFVELPAETYLWLSA